MRKLFLFLGAALAMNALAGINANRAVSVPYNMYVEPYSHSCIVTWEDDDNSAWNLRYRLYSEEPEEPVLLHSLSGSAYTGNYADITLPAPWSGVNVRGGNNAIYIKNNYNNVAQGYIKYTIPDGYNNATFTLMVTSQNSASDGVGDVTVSTPQTAAVSHNFSKNETFYWVVTASSGEQITMISNDASYSPNMTLIAVYSGDASPSKNRANEWTNVNNLDKMEYTIEDLEPETDYEVQVQAIGSNGTLSDWCRADVFTTLAEGDDPIIPSVHILGEVDDQVWSPYAGTKMEYDPDTETYTATVHIEEGATFGFTTEIDDNEDMGGWDYIWPFRFGPESDGIFMLYDQYLGQHLTLSYDNFSDIQVTSTGTYEITVSLEQHYIIVGKLPDPVIPDVYVLGQINDQNWAPNAGTKMEYDEVRQIYTGTYTLEVNETFGFTTELAENNDQGGWDYIEPFRFGPESNGDFFLYDEFLGQPLTLTFDNYGAIKVLSAGQYKVTVNLETNAVVVEKVIPAGLRGDVNDDKVVDITDATMLINYLLSSDPTGINMVNANCDLQGGVDISDATTLINFLLNSEWPD